MIKGDDRDQLSVDLAEHDVERTDDGDDVCDERQVANVVDRRLQRANS